MFQTKNPHGTIRDALSSTLESIAYPNKEQAIATNPEMDAAHGSGLVNNEPPQGLWDELKGERGLENIKKQGNQGQGMDSGLKTKGVAHQEELAARSRLARSGAFEPHTTHERMVNAHPDIAGECQEPPSLAGGGVGKMVEENRIN
ncbi:hypothetical protein JCM11641_005347 [Rhodosporidiobolus odoratus]